MRVLILCLLIIVPQSVSALVLNSGEVIYRTRNESLQGKSIKLNQTEAHQNLRQSRSQYDPLLTGSFSYTKDKSERTNTIFGSESSQTAYTVGASQLLPSGTNLSLQFSDVKETTDAPFAASPSLHNATTQLSISQPLLKNGLGFQSRYQVKLAKQLFQASKHQVQGDLMFLTLQNLQIYWNWHLQQQLKRINSEALSAALRLHRTNRQKMVIGLIEKADLYAFSANVDLKRSDLYLAEVNLNTAESSLRVALNLPSQKLSLGTEDFKSKKYPSVEKMTQEALDNHPAYLALKTKVGAQKTAVAIDRNSKLPQLDLTGSLSLNGIDPRFTNATGDVADGNPVWMGGVNLSFPLLNRNARAGYKKSLIQQQRDLYALKNLENQIVSMMREGYNKYLKAHQRMQVVSKAMKNQKLKWEGEVSRYDQGRSDPDIVIRYQDDYLNTKKLYAQARAEFQLAKAELDYYRGYLRP